MANTYLKANRIAAAALGVLEREIVLPQLVWRDPVGPISGVAGDTVTIRVPARGVARSRPLRGARPTASEGEGIIQLDELTETSVDVVLDEDIYHAMAITDEELTLDITDFGQQILLPQVRAVAEGLENKLANTMVNASYANTVTIPRAKLADGTTDSTQDWDTYRGMVEARRLLNVANVPQNDRLVVVGSDMEAAFLNDPHLNRYNQSGSASALRDATIGSIAGFGTIVVSNALPPGFGVAYHRSAFVMSMQAPVAPRGASFGATQGMAGLNMRWLMDYDLRNLQDRSVLDCYAGTGVIADGKTAEVQTLTISGSPTGGTFTLTLDGKTTAAIAYNATAAQVAAALNKLNGVNVTVSLSGAVYTVTFREPVGNANQLTAAGSFTGGSSPAITPATSTPGTGSGSLVRAVKLVLAA